MNRLWLCKVQFVLITTFSMFTFILQNFPIWKIILLDFPIWKIRMLTDCIWTWLSVLLNKSEKHTHKHTKIPYTKTISGFINDHPVRSLYMPHFLSTISISEEKETYFCSETISIFVFIIQAVTMVSLSKLSFLFCF